jgi:hypothetical protein
MNLKFLLDKEGKKVYTLKSSINNKPTQEAHYKFIKFDKRSKDEKEG